MEQVTLRPEIINLVKVFSKTSEPPLYKGWLKVYSDMVTHTQGRVGIKLAMKRPGEPTDIYQYRIANFRPITKGSIQKAVSNICRIFQDQSWSFNGSKELASFVTDNMFCGLTFKQWKEKYVVPNMIEDPNAVLMWLPTVDGESFEPKIFNSRKIRYMSADAVIVVDKDINSSAIELLNTRADADLSKQNYLRQENRFIAATKWGVYLFVKNNDKYSVTPIIDREFDFIPCATLGGVMLSSGYYESFFQSYCAFADEALSEYSDHQAVNVLFSYPIREELGEKCSNKKCRGGVIITDGVETQCRVCNGLGKIPVRSPYGVYFKAEKRALDDSGKSEPSVEFRSPDVGILDYSSREWEKKLQKAEDSIQLVRIWDNQSGIAKMIDREGLYSLLTDIKNNIFDNVIYKSLLTLEYYLNDTPTDPVVYKPTDIVIKSSSDYIEEVKSASDALIPKFITSQILLDGALRKYTANDYRRKIIEVISRIDPFFSYSESEKERLVAVGLFDKIEIQKSILLPMLLDRLANQQSNFAQMTDEAIVVWVEKEIKLMFPPVTPTVVQFDANGNPI